VWKGPASDPFLGYAYPKSLKHAGESLAQGLYGWNHRRRERFAWVHALLGRSTVCLLRRMSSYGMPVLGYTCAWCCTSSGTSELWIL